MGNTHSLQNKAVKVLRPVAEFQDHDIPESKKSHYSSPGELDAFGMPRTPRPRRPHSSSSNPRPAYRLAYNVPSDATSAYIAFMQEYPGKS